MVLPLLVLAVLTCLMVSAFFFETTARQCLMHRAMRCQADELTGHTLVTGSGPDASSENTPEQVPGHITLSTSRSGLFQIIHGKEETAMIYQGILRSRVSESTESIWHASDGVTCVRFFTTVRRSSEDK